MNKYIPELTREFKIEITLKQLEIDRQRAYQSESDPIFFKYQRGEATKKDWLDAIEAIKVSLNPEDYIAKLKLPAIIEETASESTFETVTGKITSTIE